MSGLTFEQLELKEEKVKELLDEPAKQYLKNATLVALLNRAYNIVNYQIDINVDNQIMVVDAIYAITAYHAFGTYGQSVSQTLQLQDIGAYRVNLEFYRMLAQQAAILVNVDIEKDVTPTDGDPLPVIESGRSLLDEHDVSSKN